MKTENNNIVSETVTFEVKIPVGCALAIMNRYDSPKDIVSPGQRYVTQVGFGKSGVLGSLDAKLVRVYKDE